MNSRPLKNILILSLFFLGGCQKEAEAIESDDHDAPYINLKQYEFTTEEGKALDFSNVTGYDNVDGLLPVELEGYVNYYRPGSYYPSLICTDTNGNQSSVTITINVVERPHVPTPDPSASVDSDEKNTCSAKKAEDPDQPCDAVIQDLSAYEKLFYGDQRDTCEKEAGKEYVCEVIRTNDGSRWGYGMKTKEN